ncbi:hypothetical protein GIB67_005718 [Kingdonia uniflora]|uniref:DYW domain-containing protein n=1 Tax=Kingdonia uniflora TaxID=39325 RepID=A0A7J7KVD9_9MAGN|nr:hypothetical protein GIB67_005718 [Kingdonia uniflora]
MHALVTKADDNPHLANTLITSYIKLGRIDYGHKLFFNLSTPIVVSYTALISAYAKCNREDEAIKLWFEVASMKSFGGMVGHQIHAHALKVGLEMNLSVNNALIGFYTKCGSVDDLVAVYEGMRAKDVITLTGMISGYMEFGMVESAVEVFDQIPGRNCISYNALLTGFCQNGEGLRALLMFREMVEDHMEISDFTLTSVVKACAVLTEKEISRQIHGFVIKCGCGSTAWIDAALLDMCTKCGRMEEAQKMFGQWSHIQSRSVVWTSIICGYAQNGQPDEAISLFCKMQADGDGTVDEVASTAVLGVCGTLGFYEMGKQIHCNILKSGFLSDLCLGNGVISMYGKCGNMEDAIKLFNLMPKHDIVSWNSLIASHLLHRQGEEALVVWLNMEKVGIKPDSVTFVLILSAYRYTMSSSVNTCRGLFYSMRSRYGIEPTSYHYSSMVGVLGYWGCFEEAEELIKELPFDPDASIWRALLDSCRLRSNTTLGRQVAKHLLAIKPQDPSTYILVSNLYSASGRWHCSDRVRNEMREKGLRKHPSRSWVIYQNKIHSFYARDKYHLQTKDIYSGLDILILECMKIGYEPDTSFVLHEVEEHQKQDFLLYHSAKLAVTYGILMIGLGRPVRVVKNIHLCGDCHTFFKYVSVVTGKEISLRDASGFHCFKNGECSCGDYW